MWGGLLDRELILADILGEDRPCNRSTMISCMDDDRGRQRVHVCHIPRQDILVPLTMFERPPMYACHNCE